MQEGSIDCVSGLTIIRKRPIILYMITQSSIPSVSSYLRARRMGGQVAAAVHFKPGVSEVEGLQQLWETSQRDEFSGAGKLARILERMELAAVRPRYVRHGPSGKGWWSNEYEDLVYC